MWMCGYIYIFIFLDRLMPFRNHDASNLRAFGENLFLLKLSIGPFM